MRATYTRPDGSALPLGLQFMDCGLRLPPPMCKGVRRWGRRVLGGRLPEMIAQCDGHRFIVPHGDKMYASVFLEGLYEPGVSVFMRRWLRSGDTVADIGANHGWFSLLMAAVVGEAGTVLAFEPMPAMVGAWRRNFALNPHLSAELSTTALGADAGSLDIHLFRGLPHGHASMSTLGRSDYVATTVAVDRLDEHVGRASTVDFIKLDVEGSELAVLRGAEGLISGRRSPSWLIEVNYTTADACGYAPGDIVEYLMERHPYGLYRLTGHDVHLERAVEQAPHGSAWLFVSEHDRDRLRTVDVEA